MRLIDSSALLKQFYKKGVHIEFDLPVEEILGEDVNVDGFATLMQDGLQAYKKMVIDTIRGMPAIDVDVDKISIAYKPVCLGKSYDCGACHAWLGYHGDANYCWNCGKKIDWEKKPIGGSKNDVLSEV